MVAMLCEDYETLPSAIYDEECPRLFRVWRKLRKSKLDKSREDKLWGIIVAPLSQSVMSKDGAKQQANYRDNLTRSLRDPEELKREDEYNSIQAEKRLKPLGVNVIKGGK